MNALIFQNNWHNLLFLNLLVILLISTMGAAAPLVVSTDFDGGVGTVVSIDQATRSISISVPDGNGWDIMWYIRVDGITPGETINLSVSGGGSHKCSNPSFSLDNENWIFGSWSQKVDADHAWFAWFPPFVPRHTDTLLAHAQAVGPWAEGFELCKSADLGRSVRGLRISEPGVPDSQRVGIWIQAKQHSWELGSGWQAYGFVEWLISEDPDAVELRRRADVTVIPIMDVDNAVRGFGGKDQSPHDHNRDWTSNPIYAEVRAAQEELTRLNDAGKLHLFMDLHNQGWNNNYYGAPMCLLRGDADFAAAFTAEIVTFPTNVKQLSTISTTANGWVESLNGSVMAGTIESNVAPPSGNTDNPGIYHQKSGAELGKAIARYFREKVTYDIIVDDSDGQAIGAWSTSTYDAGYFGDGYRHDGNSGKGEKSFTFSFAVPANGLYEVNLRWTASDVRASNVPVVVTSGSGLDTQVVNMQENGGSWYTLGEYDFNAAAPGLVTLLTEGTNGYVIADAIAIRALGDPVAAKQEQKSVAAKHGRPLRIFAGQGFMKVVLLTNKALIAGRLIVTDLQGRRIIESGLDSGHGRNEWNIPIHGMSEGTFVFCILDELGRKMISQRFVLR